MHHRLFEILKLEQASEIYEEQAAQSHNQKSFEFIWLESGGGLHLVNQSRSILKAHCFYCIAPGQQHQVLFDPGAKGYMVSFTRDFLLQQSNMPDALEETQLHRQFVLSPEIHVPEIHAEELTDVLAIMFKEKGRNPLLRNDIICSYLKILLLLLGKQINDAGGSSVKTGNKLVDRFFSLVENNFRERWTITEYASALFVTPNYLNNVIKSITGYTTRHHIQQRVLLEAKVEFRRKGASMKQIAYELGFDDMGHFSKFFKNTSGESFTAFKKQLNKGVEASVQSVYASAH